MQQRRLRGLHWLVLSALLAVSALSAQGVEASPTNGSMPPAAPATRTAPGAIRAPSAPMAPLAPLDVPEVLVPSGASDFMRVDTTLYWHSIAPCVIIPHTPIQAGPAPAAASANGDNPETISRLSTISASPTRLIFSQNPARGPNDCNPYQMYSRVVADQDFLYWVDAAGLEKLPRNANPGDAPAVLSAAFSDQQPYNIAIGSQFVYLSRNGYLGCGVVHCIVAPIIDKVDKASGTITQLLGGLLNTHYGFDLKVDPGERYLYYREATSGSATVLQRMDLGTPATITALVSDATAYYPAGRQLLGCVRFVCFFTDYVFIAHGNTAAGQLHEILRYDNQGGTSVSIYQSGDTTDSVSINDIVSDGSNIFFFEQRSNICLSPPCFVSYTGWLFRSGIANANALANIYQTGPSIANGLTTTYGLDDDGTKLYWLENGVVKRLSNEATALPKSPMHIVGMEVTQGVQTTANSVPLIQGKRTFVRLYVQSDDPSRDVPGVTARLSATWTGGTGGGSDGPIAASNLMAITVKRTPSRAQLNDAFLFEVPWSWVSGDNLVLTAELNPGHNPEQSDNYVNNVLTNGPFHLNPPPRVELRLFEYYYSMGGATFGPAYDEKFGNTDWIRKAYPVDESNGTLQTPGGGLRWSYSRIIDNALADKVRYPDVPCEDKDTTPAASQNPKLADCQNLRASAYVSNQIAGMRDDLRAFGDTDNTTYYGLIVGGSELRGVPATTVTYFPRGQDGGKNGAGPAGQNTLGWYAGHEVGHSVGLGHPATAAAGNDCGIKGSDSLPTYPNGHIGDNNDATNVEAFLDLPTYNYPRYDNTSLAQGSKTMDVMAYCRPQWLSDQNFSRIYSNLTGVTPTAATRGAQQNGDWLVVYGSILPASNTATMDYLRHKIGNVTVPLLVPGPYALRLRDGSGNTLADYAFTPTPSADAALQTFGQAVPFAAGTRDVRIVRLADGTVLADQVVGAGVPTVGNVALVNPPNPVSGVVALAWTASDPDGLPLQFDVLYSRDGGASFQPVALHLTGSSAAIDTAGLGGGSGRFRVVASDGANTASADSALFTMAAKPPLPVITLPANNEHIHYGQTVNFAGEAGDAQDGLIADGNLSWWQGATMLGSGHLLTQKLLPPGTDVLTFTATNSAGLAASTTVTVIVDDNIDPDGPTLQVAPGAIVWNVNAGVTALQTQGLAVSNSGRGSLTWQVTSDAAWLTVSAVSGNAGDTIVATGNPSGMLVGETRTGHLTFTSSSGAAPQTLVVPVTLIKGSLYGNPYLGPQPRWGWGVYLPLTEHP